MEVFPVIPSILFGTMRFNCVGGGTGRISSGKVNIKFMSLYPSRGCSSPWYKQKGFGVYYMLWERRVSRCGVSVRFQKLTTGISVGRPVLHCSFNLPKKIFALLHVDPRRSDLLISLDCVQSLRSCIIKPPLLVPNPSVHLRRAAQVVCAVVRV